MLACMSLLRDRQLVLLLRRRSLLQPFQRRLVVVQMMVVRRIWQVQRLAISYARRLYTISRRKSKWLARNRRSGVDSHRVFVYRLLLPIRLRTVHNLSEASARHPTRNIVKLLLTLYSSIAASQASIRSASSHAASSVNMT